MKEIALQDAKARLADVVAQSLDAPVLITRNGKREAVIMPARLPLSGKVVQGKRGATGLYAALRAAPGELKLKRLRGKFRPADL
jgi:prevent-host-death family protein